MAKKIMEFHKSIFLLLISSLLSNYANAVCVSRNVSSSSPSPAHSPSPLLSSSPHVESPAESPKQPPIMSSLPPTSLPPSASYQNSHSFKRPFFPFHSHDIILHKICSVTEHPRECIDSITPFLTNKDIDALSILQIEMKALRNGFEKAIATAKIMMNAPSTSAWIRSCLDTCIDVYDSGVGDLDNAFISITSRDIYRLRTLLSSCISYVESCEDSFTEMGGDESPMKEVDAELSILASNNLAIATLLHWKQIIH